MTRSGGIAAIAAVLGAGLAFAPTASAFSFAATNVPFVGCPLRGQTVSVPAPQDGPRPLLDPAKAGRLAYYGVERLGVLAPRGWRCVAVSGSNGMSVVVTPRRLRPDALGARVIPGPGISISHSYGRTSGRFAVARAIARYFPERQALLPMLLRGSDLDDPLAAGSWPADRIEHPRPHEIRFRTPAGRQGEGTAWLFAPEGGPVQGAVILVPEQPDLITVRVRLPKKDADLAELVVAWNPAIER